MNDPGRTPWPTELYHELRRLAHRQMRGQPPGHTLQTTGLVHEAFLRLRAADPQAWNDRAHFLRSAAQAMRSVLVDHARARKTEKRGGDRGREPLDAAELDRVVAAYEASHLDVLALDEALDRLEADDPELAELARLRFFAGLTVPEVADVVGVSVPTVERRWRVARAALRALLDG